MTDPTTTHNTPPPRASAEDWLALESACSLLRLPSSAFARCLIDLRDCFLDELRPRMAALEAATGADHASAAGKMVAPTPTAAPAGGVTVRELANALERLIDDAPRYVIARYILNHPRIAPLLRGEGAARAEVARQQGEGS